MNEIEADAHPDGGLFGQRRLLLLLGLLLQLVVRHGDDGQDQVEQVERAQEDDDDEEEHVPRAGRSQHQLVQVLPVVLHHEPEGGEQRPAEAVETGVAVIGIVSVAL